MSYESYEEDILYDIQDYLSANLCTYLEGIEREKSDDIILPDIKKYYVGDKDIYKLNIHPAGLLFPQAIDYETLSLQQDNVKIEIIFTVVIKGGKTENLTLKILRYAAAVRQCLSADKTAGGTVDRTKYVKTLFYARPPGIEDKMVVDLLFTAEKCIPG